MRLAAGRRGEFRVDGEPCAYVRDGPLAGRPLIVLAHGAGAPLDSPFMATTARGLVDRGLAVLRFHFPYMERRVREGSRRPPDRTPRLLAAWREILAAAGRFRGRGRIVLGGKSMGGRIASLLLAAGDAREAVAAVYLGFPLHPAGKPGTSRADHLARVPVPQLFVSGTRDPWCELRLLAGVLAPLAPAARLFRVEGGDHSLAVRRADPDPSPAWLSAVAEFVEQAAQG